MSDLHISLLNSDMNFDQLYDVVRQELVEFQKNVDELQVLGESEIDQHNVNQVFQALKTIQLQQLNLKEKIIKLEQQSRGVEQRNKTKKLRDLYTSHLQRQQQLYKNMVNDCGYEPLKDVLKEIDKMMKLSSKQDVQNYVLNSQIQSKQSTSGGSTNQSQMQLQNVEPLEQYEHLDWNNQLIKQNQEDLDKLQMKAYTVNKIVQDLALEIEHQGTIFDEIETNVTTTMVHVVGAGEQLEKTQEQQKSGKKKLWCMLICAFITFLVLLLILLL
ncbi:unnamed protein product (macronuclear) [Paramecium tetraurelia]|uniref:Chromosome undetermined scaffold_76, whole genome shotgun sequence n=1 Tax=Paramecium tetraurelia TaxID=5888 RepID=Q3M100_PARTE|nr:uncharacterized protein GSPATT00022869001 [Paramecium tetraurelia]CAH69622.1 syntaxin 9-1 [Paramecium tetraurelia]CAK89696.1 unnamed protein product [Paramecium tetraurelia]|eukprot:XP_001457093.1 hypothetical protein (macronuclear) [Paramecium tetraurelia strain d4-2]